MATPAQIDEQVKLERECIKCGVDRLHKDTRKAEEREYASSSIYGNSSIQAAQEHVAKLILSTFNRINEGKNAVAFADIAHHLAQFNEIQEAHKLANIALKRTFDTVFSRKRKDDRKFPNSVSNVTTMIGAAVEAECQMRWYENQNPQVYKQLKDRYWLSSTGTRQKQSIMSIMMSRREYKWDRWSAALRGRIGGWLLSLVCDATGWFTKTKDWQGKKSTTLIVPTELYLEKQGEIIHNAELFAPLAFPMLIEPNDWTNDKPGGYLLNELMRGHELVRRGDPSLRQPDIPLDFLNKLQKVAYRINPFVFDVACVLDEKGYKLGKFKPLSYAANWHIPSPPHDVDTNAEARMKYRRDRTDAENARKAYLKSIHVKTSATLEVAKKYKDRDAFFLPWSFDYRGRAYPIPSYLTPHDTDFGKSLLRFSVESTMTAEAEEWLAFQVATTYGLDKATIKDRLQWALDNFTLISAVATDPIGNMSEWENVDEPWQFLAACDEYYHCVINRSRNTTGLCVAVDATCSGLQILAGLARDKGTAELVNVVPTDSPKDAYKSVLEAMEDIPERLKPYCDRGTTKRSVMTIPYNATIQSSRDYIKKALHDNMPKDVERVTSEEATIMAKSLRKALGNIAPGCLAIRDWIGKEMTAAIKRGSDVIRWTTPSGFKVRQKRNKFSTIRLDLAILGRTQFSVVDKELGPDPRKHKSSGAPNVIHSLDASLLHLTFQRFDVPFSVIHDSVLCRATDMSDLSTLVRKTYMNIFTDHDFIHDFAQQIGAETEPPIIGDLEPSSVIESTYFFC